MRTRILIFLVFLMGLLFLCSNNLMAQASGDFRTNATGNWGTTTIWDSLQSDLTTWVAAGKVPGLWNNVLIRSGHTITMEASGKSAKNFVVESGAVLTSAGAVSAANYLTVTGDTLHVDGKMGSAAIGLGVNVNKPSGTLKIQGNNIDSCVITRLRPATGIAGVTIVINRNLYLNYPASSTGSTIYNNSQNNLTVTINAGATVTTATGGYIAVGTSGTNDPSTGGNLTINLYGTITTGTNGNINLRNAATFTTTLNIYNGGVLNIGGTLVAPSATAGSVAINIASGGTINLVGAYAADISKATYTLDGTIDLANATSANLGTATISSTGKLRLKSGTYPTGTITSNAGSTVEYYGSSAITLGTQATYENLLLSNSAGVTLGGNVTVNGVLSLTGGNLSTGANILAIGSSGSILRTSAYILGTLQKNISTGSNVAVTYEVGSDYGYSPLNMVFGTVSTAGNFSAAIVQGKHANIVTSGIDTTKKVNQYWILKNTGTVYDSYTGTMNYLTNAIDAAANPSNFIARTYSSGAWSPLTVGTKTATSTQVTSTSTIGDSITLGEVLNYTISASSSANGTISPTGDVVINSYGQTQKYTITANSGYAVDSILVDGVKVDSTLSYTFVNIGANHTIAAYFGVAQFTIAASAGANGSISPSGNVGSAYGSSRNFSFTPSTGYHVDSVFVDGTLQTGTPTSYQFENITASHTIRVTFAINSYTISASAGANGAISPVGDLTNVYGSTIVYAITPDTHYHVDSLLVDGVKVDSTLSYTFLALAANHNIRAVFAIDTYSITATAGTGGTITPSGDVKVPWNGTQVFTIGALRGYLLDSVLVDNAKVDSTTSYTFTNVITTHTITTYMRSNIRSLVSNGTGGGDWNSPTTWAGALVPAEFDTVSIAGTDSVKVTGEAVCSVLKLAANGRLFVPATDSLTITSPDSANLIAGIINNSGKIKLTATGKLKFGQFSVYKHTQNGGSIPSSIWGYGSTCEILGLVGNAPSNGNQNFFNIVWNCPGQTGNLNMGWNGNTIGGDITIINTGNSRWQMCAPTAGTSGSPNTATVTINGNINQTGGAFSSNGTGNAYTAITIHTMGDINVTGGNFSVSRGSQGSGTGTTTWYLYGDLVMANCTTQNSNPIGAKFVFTASYHSLLTHGVTFDGNGLPVEVLANVTVNIDTSVITGAGIFTAMAGSQIETRHPDGLSGNLKTTGVISLSPQASYYFSGSVAQVTSTMLPDTVHTLTINNASGVKLSKATVVNGVLVLHAGVLDNTLPVTLGPGGSINKVNGSTLFPVGSKTVTIAEARKDLNGDLIADHKGIDTLIVTGVVTSPNFQAPAQTAIFIQDATAGIEIFSFTAPHTNIQIGDSVMVIGVVDQYRGTVEIIPLQMDATNVKILKHGAAVPAPINISVHEFAANPEVYEGSLVKVDCVTKARGTWPATGSNGSVYVTAYPSGADTIQMFIDKETEIDGTTEPRYPLNVTGIAMQYSSGSTVYNNGYELVPRFLTDIKALAAPIVIDAQKDEFYNSLTGPDNGYLQIKNYAANDNGTPRNNEDLSAKVWVAWDTAWFYMYSEVIDDTISGNSRNTYEEDGLELKFDAQPYDSTVNSIWPVGITALGMGTSGVVNADSLAGIPDSTAKQWARKIIPGGYALEVAIKWSAVGIGTTGAEKVSVAEDSVFGLAICFHDNDGRARREASIEWGAAMLDAVWNTPKYLGTVKFLADNKLSFIPKNKMTGLTNPIPYDGTPFYINVDGAKDNIYNCLTGPQDGYLQIRSYAWNDNGKPSKDNDLSAKVWTAWDPTWFYLYTEVKDDTLCGNAPYAYQEDGMELKFDPQPTDTIKNSIWSAGITALGMGSPGVIAADSLSVITEPTDKQWARRKIFGGYALELAMKWSAIGQGITNAENVKVEQDSVFGLAICFHDNDSTKARVASIEWAAVMLDEVWNTPKYLGTVKFLADNKLSFIPTNNMTGVTNPIPYNGSNYTRTGVSEEQMMVPESFSLSQNYPNPLNPSTTIEYALPTRSIVTVKIYSILGQEVATLVNGEQGAGYYRTVWNASNQASGMYYLRITAQTADRSSASFTKVKKMMLIK